MTVNGFELPAAFVQLSKATERGEAPDRWGLKENVDAYGQPWENYGVEILTDPKEIADDTCWLERKYREDHGFRNSIEARGAPGFINDFTGVSHFVRFATSPTGEFYCFDFGGDPREPSVVYWDTGGYWRRLAPNFSSFLALFVDYLQSPQWLADDVDDEDDEDDEE
jgi:hypothetical protein